MRQRRIKVEGNSYYHCISRTVENRFIFRPEGSAEGEYFVKLMRRQERACCLEVLTYSLMSNHIHILCRVPERRQLSDEELLDCIEAGFGRQHRQELQRRLRACKASEQTAQLIRAKYLKRLFDVSVFMKELKGQFAQWYNRRSGRYGVLWAERFKSTLIENGAALKSVAAYIDLNPLRAGLCQDPKDYRYSGYGEASANQGRAQRALAEVMGAKSWRAVSYEYRKLLFRVGTQAKKGAKTIDQARARQVVESQNGQLSLGELLRCRVRYFTDGGIIGSQAFVQEQFARLNKIAAQVVRTYRISELGGPELFVLRNLRGNRIVPFSPRLGDVSPQ
ncbi:MAG: transposase [Verrucomicrobia bacterium]|nr:transposase [Verrucomicrobiota bacterium]